MATVEEGRQKFAILIPGLDVTVIRTERVKRILLLLADFRNMEC